MEHVQAWAIISILVCFEQQETVINEPQDYYKNWFVVGGLDGSKLQQQHLYKCYGSWLYSAYNIPYMPGTYAY